jgi:hypothetical protein
MAGIVSDRFGLDEPVCVFDRLTVLPGCQREVLRRFEVDYRPLAAERGLRQVGSWTLPPFDRPNDPADIMLQWEYPSLGVFWMARGAEEGDARLDDFWSGLDALLVSRARQLGRPGLIDGMVPSGEASSCEVISGDSGRPRAVAFVRPGACDAAGRAAMVARIEAHGARGGFNAGAYTGRPDELTIDWDGSDHVFLKAFGAVEEVVTLGEPVDFACRQPGLGGGVKRTILLRTMNDARLDAVALMERRLGEWARHLPEMRNWSVSRVTATTGPIAWTHCFEQEFADVADITGPYLNHPFHWSVVDRLFHPEAPERVADAFFHSIYPIERSVLADFRRKLVSDNDAS